MDLPDGECVLSEPKLASPVEIQWRAVQSGAYAVLCGMSLEAAARVNVPIPAESYWSDVLQDAVLSLLDPLNRSFPRTASEIIERLERTAGSDNDPHPALRDFAGLPLSQQIEKLARMAKTRRDNQQLSLRRRLKIYRDNHPAIHENWTQVSAADLIEDIIRRDKQKLLIKTMCRKLAQPDIHLLLAIISEGMPDERRATQLGFKSAIETRNALRRIRTAAKSTLRMLQEIDDVG